MLKVNAPKSQCITHYKESDGDIIFYSERGMLRIESYRHDIIRVTYTEEEVFDKSQKIGIIDEPCDVKWTVDPIVQGYLIETEHLHITISREGTVSFHDKQDKCIFAERAYSSHCLDAFDTKQYYHTRLHLSFQEDEALYGLGQHEEGVMNLRHTVQYLHQANMKVAIPMIVSSKGYGLLINTYSPAIFRDDTYGSYIYTEADTQLDYFFIYGQSMDGVVKGYRQLTGKAALLPKWAYGYIQSQEQYANQEEIVEVVKGYRERQIGLDCIVMDWNSWPQNMWGQKTFNTEMFPQPTAMIDTLHQMHTHFMLSVWPTMNEASANYKAFFDKRLLLPATTIYNALSEEGRKLYWQQAEEGLFSKGVDAWWCDASEPFTPEWDRPMKPEPERMYHDYLQAAGDHMPMDSCNAYGVYHAKGMYEGQRGSGSQKRVMNLTRSGYLGQQRYGAVIWSGDISASWDTLKRQIPAGLNFCASGLPYWTLDAGGFFVKKGEQWFWNGDYPEGNEDVAYRELATRWYQYAAFLPIFRGHGTDVRRELWLHGGEGSMFYEAMLKSNRLRYQLMPYIYSLAANVWQEDETMMRLLSFDFPKDAEVWDIKDQFMFGKAMMVCPVTTPMYDEKASPNCQALPQTRPVYLPKGCVWYDFWTGTKYAGGSSLDAAAPIDRIPIYVRAGSLVPTCQPTQYVDENLQADWEVLVYPGADGTFTLYEDAGDSYDYEKGAYCTRELRWSEADKCLSIGDVKGDFEGFYKDRKITYKIIG